MSATDLDTDLRTSTTTLDRPPPLGAYLFLVIQGQRPLDSPARIALDGLDEVVVGRGPARSILAGARRVTVQLGDTKISRSHATFTRRGGTWRLKDQGSVNGTRVNGNPIVTPQELKDGDRIEIGYTFFVFRDLLPCPSGTPTVLDATAFSGVPRGFCSLLPTLRSDMEKLEKVARTKISVLLLGETGTGKEVLARDLHKLSDRAAHPIKPINCGGIAPGILESEIFGHTKGAFSGADRSREGYFRAADGGTLFLDEIGDLPLTAQAALLRALSEGEVARLGEEKAMKVNVRVIAATNRPLDEMLGRQAFRLDLLQRLEEHRHLLAPLRDRLEDLGLILRALLPRVMDQVMPEAEQRPDAVSFHPSALRAMFEYAWPGNVRELEACLKDALALASRKGNARRITAQDLTEKLKAPAPEEKGPGPKDKNRWVSALRSTRGNVSQAARKLKMVRQTLSLKLKKHNIDPKEFRPSSRSL